MVVRPGTRVKAVVLAEPWRRALFRAWLNPKPLTLGL